MKAKNYRTSLAFAIVLILLALLFSGICLMYSRQMILPPFDGYVKNALECVSLSSELYGSMSLAAAFLAEAVFMLAYRRKKRASMYISFLLIALIYTTVLVYAHIINGIDSPAWLMSHVSGDKPWLLLVCTALEIMLLFAFPVMLRPIDRRILSRHELRMKKMNAAASEKEAEVENAEEAVDDAKQKAKDDKDALKYMKAKEKKDRKLQKKAEREAAKDEKHYQKYAAKQEAKARKEEEKARRKLGKGDDGVSDDTADAFTTVGASSRSYTVNPSDPVSFPDIASIPSLRTIDLSHGEDGDEEEIPAEPTPVEESPVRSHDTVVFSQLKDEIERNDKKDEIRKRSDFTKPMTFNKGGMLEATLESILTTSSVPPLEQGPIIGYDDEKKSRKDEKPHSSIAPSNLSPSHPRYKLFEALSQNKNVSHFPSKGFVPEEKDEEDLSGYGTVFSSTEEKKKKVSIPEVSLKKETAIKAEKEKEAEEEEEIDVAATAILEDEKPVEKKVQAIDPFSAPLKKKTPEKEEEPSLFQEDEKREDFSQENELLLSVGIGGLQSNELGFAGISKRSKKRYTAPSADFLVDYPEVSTEIDDLTREQGEEIVNTLLQFHTEVSLDNIVKGPTVTMFELKLKEGTPVSRVRARYDELSYNLGGVQIRILAPVPGKQAVGIEVPNRKRAVIGFKDMLKAMKKDPDAKKLRVPMILGRTITGKPMIIDVAKMPHMLIAGTTGSGKSVCINAFICTVLYTRAPQDVRFIMVDPKVVELSVYNGIPHLLTPVITEAKKVVRALAWLCDEMERRYRMLSKYGVRNIDGFNSKIISENIPAERMPYIVLIMDEFADLMTTVGKDIENYVARLAAKARAAGIHLVLATQRPSADVITGTIKNNFPSRIAFAVSSATNSRIILDDGGAENLLGRGDMLFMNPSVMGNERIQGAFLSDEEVDAIVSFEQKNSTPDYLAEDIFEEPVQESDSGSDDVDVSDEDSDEVLYEKAKEIVYERKMASASFLQRRMKIGYNRAARLIEMMEDNGIIGPANGSKPREILKYE